MLKYRAHIWNDENKVSLLGYASSTVGWQFVKDFNNLRELEEYVLSKIEIVQERKRK